MPSSDKPMSLSKAFREITEAARHSPSNGKRLRSNPKASRSIAKRTIRKQFQKKEARKLEKKEIVQEIVEETQAEELPQPDDDSMSFQEDSDTVELLVAEIGILKKSLLKMEKDLAKTQEKVRNLEKGEIHANWISRLDLAVEYICKWSPDRQAESLEISKLIHSFVSQLDFRTVDPTFLRLETLCTWYVANIDNIPASPEARRSDLKTLRDTWIKVIKTVPIEGERYKILLNELQDWNNLVSKCGVKFEDPPFKPVLDQLLA